MTAPNRSPQQWEEWFAEFKRRNGLTPEKLAELAHPKPKPSAATPPKPHTEAPEREPGEEG